MESSRLRNEEEQKNIQQRAARVISPRVSKSGDWLSDIVGVNEDTVVGGCFDDVYVVPVVRVVDFDFISECLLDGHILAVQSSLVKEDLDGVIGTGHLA